MVEYFEMVKGDDEKKDAVADNKKEGLDGFFFKVGLVDGMELEFVAHGQPNVAHWLT